MQDCPVPERAGETLGDYYWWGWAQHDQTMLCNEAQTAERAYYLGD